MAKILIIEDDPEIQEMLKFAFRREGWQLFQALNGEDGLKALKSGGADCVILDIMLPGMDGLKTLKKIRQLESPQSLPVIICSARGEEADIVSGLELGADDYVAKPYSPLVLAARVRAALRRTEEAKNIFPSKTFFQHGNLCIDTERHTAYVGENKIDLLATEFAILAQFMTHPDIVFSRQKLIDAVHGPDYPVTDRSVDVQIAGLRKKLKEAGDMIETIRGIGYKFTTANL